MTTAFRRTLARLIVCVGLAAGTTLATMPAGHADSDKVFGYNRDIKVGDCTMFHGAYWLLHSDGYAEFHAVVTSSDDNDAWLMHAALFDAHHTYLGNIVSNWTTGGDLGKFVLNLGSSAVQYHWDLDREHKSEKTYRPEAFSTVTSIELQNNC